MRYNRQESLRYTFQDPPSTLFKIIQIDEQPVKTSNGSGFILNLSPSGMLLSTGLKLPFQKNIQLLLNTTLSNKPVEWKAEVVWGKEIGTTYQYGLTLLDDHQEEIIHTLKQYNANQDFK
ncbi:PilZ domain-containing protein [Halobacillus seohaensis]|uniref:PilZ domain-containing protein n=1 Tax=Halobacillus seohaensis TaxID=447421 RepID=A0ABW2EKD4_9BACI